VPFYENMSSNNSTDMQAEGKSEAMDDMGVLGPVETQTELPALAAAATDVSMMAAVEQQIIQLKEVQCSHQCCQHLYQMRNLHLPCLLEKWEIWIGS
jgi:hypothetical protein